MSQALLLPGYGSKYTSAAILGVSGGTLGADEIDTRPCSQFAVQITSVTNAASSTVQVEQTMDGTNWAALGTATTIVLGAILRFGSASGPYGKIRLKVTDAANAVVVAFVIVGFEMQTGT